MPFIPHKRRVASSWITNNNENHVKLSIKQNPQIVKSGGSLANSNKINNDYFFLKLNTKYQVHQYLLDGQIQKIKLSCCCRV